jgi:hypothetical protein
MTWFGIIFLGGSAVVAAVALLSNVVLWKLEERRDLHRSRVPE